MLRIGDSYQEPGVIRVTWWLLALNLLSFLASAYGHRHRLDDLVFIGGVIPANYTGPATAQGLGLLIPLIFYQFLHGGWFHLLSNSAALFVFGPNVEAYMGRWRFLLFYLSCGCAGALLHILFNLGSQGPIIGASGAISGLFGAYLRVYPKNYIRISVGSLRSGRYRDALIPIKVILIYWGAIQVIDALLPGAGTRNSIAYLSHLGGFAAGYLIASGRGLGTPRRKFKVFTGGQGVAG